MAGFEITRGAVAKPQKVVIYGPEGVGKTTLAAQFPSPLFIDTEDGSGALDVARLPSPTSWQMLLDEVAWVRDFPAECGGTLVLDTADWAERLCVEQVCQANDWKSIEDPGYGRGYNIAANEFGKLLNLLGELPGRGLNVVVTAHAVINKFEQPDELGAYDRWGLKLIDGKRASVAAMVKEWADALLFANFKTVVVALDKDGKKHKAQGGKNRVLYCTHAAAWDAKNRWGLPDEVPMAWEQIAPHIPVPDFGAATSAQEPAPDPAEPPTPEEVAAIELPFEETEPEPEPAYLGPLRDLMAKDGVTDAVLMEALHRKGYAPAGQPLAKVAEDLAGHCVATWPQVVAYINAGMPQA